MEIDFGPVNWSSDSHHVLLNPRWPADDLNVLRDAAARVLKMHASAPSLVLSSSGTTAGSWREVKLIVLAKAAVLAGARAVNDRFGFGPSDVFGQVLPTFHVGGLAVEARARLAGAPVVDLRGEEGWNAPAFHVAAAGAGATVLSLVPTQLFDLLEKDLSPWSGLRTLFVGGGALAPGLEARARAFGWPVVATYGMTETSAMIACRAEADSGLGLEPFVGIEVRATPEGMVKVRSSSLASGFARLWGGDRLEWTAIGEEFVTDDRGEIKNGRLFVFGREKDQIKIAGENVNLAALRRLLEDETVNAGVAPSEVHLTWIADERRGAALVLVVRQGSSAESLRRAYDGKVLPFERIQAVIEVPEIPCTESGKVREELLRDRLREMENPNMEKRDSRWSKGALFICEKCGRRKDADPSLENFAETAKTEFKTKLKDLGHGKDVRVMVSGCVGECPPKRQAAAWFPKEGRERILVFDADDKDEVFAWLMKKAKS